MEKFIKNGNDFFIFFLLKKVDDRILVKTELKELIAHFQEPLDEKDLQVLILEVLVPSSEKMLEYILTLI